MARPRTELGDSHNFGRRVVRRAGRIVKPRPLLWEWLVLSADSPLRRLLVTCAKEEGASPETFTFLPSLKFFSSRDDEGGEVEQVKLEPLPAPSEERRRELALIVGRSLALWSWLGVQDLHWENLVLGADSRGRVVFAPLDVEMILADLSLPTETKLLPDADPEYAEVCRHASGVRRVLPQLGKPVSAETLVSMAGAYCDMLSFLDRHARAIARVFEALPGLRETPIRVCLRGTGDYVHARSQAVWPPLLDAEAQQLARGDIPYFFRLYGRPGIHYYADASLSRVETLPLRGDVPRLEPLLRVTNGLRAPSRKKLREDGLFALLGAFDHAALSGAVESEKLSLKFAARSLVARLETGEELRSRRNLRAFVGSVYLPCRCGEVRSVFVPAVTRCRASVLPDSGVHASRSRSRLR
jgi:hypothetical protein